MARQARIALALGLAALVFAGAATFFFVFFISYHQMSANTF